jgi:hypothetical protein
MIWLLVEPTIKIGWRYDHYWWSNAQFSVFTKCTLVAKPWIESRPISKGNKLCPHTIRISSIKGKAQFVVELLAWRRLNDHPNTRRNRQYKNQVSFENLVKNEFEQKQFSKNLKQEKYVDAPSQVQTLRRTLMYMKLDSDIFFQLVCLVFPRKWCETRWWFRLRFKEYFFPQMWQSYGFSPVCTLLWSFTCSFRLKAFSQ